MSGTKTYILSPSQESGASFGEGWDWAAPGGAVEVMVIGGEISAMVGKWKGLGHVEMEGRQKEV